jgi:hypothetical protein
MHLVLNLVLAALVAYSIGRLLHAAGRTGSPWRARLADAAIAFGNELGVYGIGSDFIEIWWVPSLSSTTSPSAAEINAGTRITDDIIAVDGFTTDTNYKEVRTLKGGIGSKLAGRQTIADSALTFAEHTTFATNTIMQALDEGDDGFVVTSRYKKGNVAAADIVTVWPARIGGNNPNNWPVEDEELQFKVSIGITSPPSKNVTAAA